jgi:hypothetical protein
MKKHIILFLAANPVGISRGSLAVDAEARAIEDELERSDHGDCFELVTRWAAQPHDLLRALRKLRPTIVHFSGHGGNTMAGQAPGTRNVVPAANAQGGAPQRGVFFQDGNRRPVFVSAEALQSTFSAVGAPVRLVVLNACYTDVQAAALLAQVDCVVGMTGAIKDEAAISFSIGFYGGLGHCASITAAYKQGRAAISLAMNDLSEADRPRLQVRSGSSASQVIATTRAATPLAAVTRQGSRLSARRLVRITAALAGAFGSGIESLHELVSCYGAIGLPASLPGTNTSPDDFIQGLVRACESLGEHVLESVVRAARRRRPDHPELARAITESWPHADGLDLLRLDALRGCLRAAGVTVDRLRGAIRTVLGTERPPLWEPLGAEPLDDLIEGLAQLAGHPPKLVVVLEQLREIPGVHAWIGGTAPPASAVGALAEGSAATTAAAAPASTPSQRLLLLLRRGVNDNYKGEIYLSAPDGKPGFVAALREQVPLARVPAAFGATCAESQDLRTALRRCRLARVEVMLPIRDLLTHVEDWDLFGAGPIGELCPVGVRPYERAHIDQHPDYLIGSMLLAASRDALRRSPTMQQVELELAQVKAAVRGHPKRWCVAAFRCSDLTCADRLAALDVLVRRGVAAMLAVRHDHGWPEHLTADHALPSSVHDHRCDDPEHPVMLLWDDVDFIPGVTT